MAKRITVVLDDEVVKKLRSVQSRQIKESSEAVSFSKVVNEALKKAI